MSGAAAGAAHGTSPPQGDSDDMEGELKGRLLQQALKHVVRTNRRQPVAKWQFADCAA